MSNLTANFDGILFKIEEEWVLGKLEFLTQKAHFISKKLQIVVPYKNLKNAVFSSYSGTHCLDLYYPKFCFNFIKFKKSDYNQLKGVFEYTIKKQLTFNNDSYIDNNWSKITVDADTVSVHYEGHTHVLKGVLDKSVKDGTEGLHLTYAPRNVTLVKIIVGQKLLTVTNLKDEEGVKRQLEFYQNYLVVRSMGVEKSYIVLAHSERNMMSMIPSENGHSLLFKISNCYEYATAFYMESLFFDIHEVDLILDEYFANSLRNLPHDKLQRLKMIYKHFSGHEIDECSLEQVFDHKINDDKRIKLYPLNRGLLVCGKEACIFPYYSVKWGFSTFTRNITLKLSATGEEIKFLSLNPEAHEHAKMLRTICNQRKFHKTMSRDFDDAYYDAILEKRKNVESDEENKEKVNDDEGMKENKSPPKISGIAKVRQYLKRGRDSRSMSEDSAHKSPLTKKDSQGMMSPAGSIIESVSCMDVRTTSKGETSNPLKQRSDSASTLPSSSVGGVGNVQLPSSARIDIAAQSLPSSGGDDRTLPSSPKKNFGKAIQATSQHYMDIARRLFTRKARKSQPSPPAGRVGECQPSSSMSGLRTALHPTPTGGDRTALHPTPTGGDRTALHPTPTGGDGTALHPTPTGGDGTALHSTPTGEDGRAHPPAAVHRSTP